MILIPRILIGLALLVAVGALSRAPYDSHRVDDAVLRLSWRLRGEPVQQCRNRTPAELEALPVHMRTPQVCSGRVSSYRLLVQIDDRVLPPMELRAAGAHADRPIYVFKEAPLSPGQHTIAVELFNTLHPDAHRLRFRERVNAKSGDVLLITHDDERGLFLLLPRAPF